MSSPCAHRVDPGDAEQVVDQAARARAPGGDPHPHAADEVHHLGHGQEVAAEAQLGDGAPAPASSRCAAARDAASAPP